MKTSMRIEEIKEEIFKREALSNQILSKMEILDGLSEDREREIEHHFPDYTEHLEGTEEAWNSIISTLEGNVKDWIFKASESLSIK